MPSVFGGVDDCLSDFPVVSVQDKKGTAANPGSPVESRMRIAEVLNNAGYKVSVGKSNKTSYFEYCPNCHGPSPNSYVCKTCRRQDWPGNRTLKLSAAVWVVRLHKEWLGRSGGKTSEKQMALAEHALVSESQTAANPGSAESQTEWKYSSSDWNSWDYSGDSAYEEGIMSGMITGESQRLPLKKKKRLE